MKSAPVCNRGLTLMEIVVSIGLVAVITLFVVGVLSRILVAGGKTAHVFAMAMTGAEELEEGHADRDKRCVGRLNATVAEVDAETLRISHKNKGRFAEHPFHRWFLVVLTLHLGVVLPVETAVCELALWA